MSGWGASHEGPVIRKGKTGEVKWQRVADILILVEKWSDPVTQCIGKESVIIRVSLVWWKNSPLPFLWIDMFWPREGSEDTWLILDTRWGIQCCDFVMVNKIAEWQVYKSLLGKGNYFEGGRWGMSWINQARVGVPTEGWSRGGATRGAWALGEEVIEGGQTWGLNTVSSLYLSKWQESDIPYS